DRLNITFAERTLEPQSAVEIGPLYVYAGPGDWRDVRRVWQRTTGVTAQAMPEPDRPHSFGLSPAPLVTLNGQVEARLRADNVREFEMQGRVVVEPPPGWTVERAEFPVEGLAHEKPLQETLCLTATGDRVGAADGQLRLETKKFDEARPFTLIRLGDESATVQVAERQQAGQSLWDVANGRCTWTVAPDYHGGVTAWREAGSDVDHLMTAFPENGELGWLKPWFGGVWPVIMPKENNDEDWPGKLHEETFTATPFEAAGADGIAWRGVQAATLIERDECKGIRVEIAYLTVGGSNV
ncbi:MAG: hypothetical protein GY856_18005, partial [bacterium]|nr:hypothetical protein [bacterium]